MSQIQFETRGSREPSKLHPWLRRLIWLAVAYIAYSVSCHWLNGLGIEIDIIQRLPSPNGRMEAVIYSRNCGVPCSFENAIAIVRPGEEISTSTTTAFRCEGGTAVDVSTAVSQNPTWVKLGWVDTRHLQISYDRHVDHIVTVEKFRMRTWIWLKDEVVMVSCVPVEKL